MPATTEALQVVPVPAFKDNYLWLLVRGREAAVVDPGDAVPVEAALAERHLHLAAILLTHHHADHTGGVGALLAREGRERMPVYGPAREAIPGVTVSVVDGDVVSLEPLGVSFTVIAVPGHTRGHIAYYASPDAIADAPDRRRAPLLFCGDTLFAAGCGRLFEGTPQQMHASLSRLASLPGDTRVHCAHEYTLANLRFARTVEPDNAALVARTRDAEVTRARGEPTLPSTIALERDTNPFLRSDVPSVRNAAERRVQGAGASALETFTVIRRWKDSF